MMQFSRTGMKKPPSITPQTLGARIRERRRRLGLNQSELALACGTGVRFISDLENGKESCHLGRSLRVLAALGLHVDLISAEDG